jgi:hypothetical protein
MSDTALERTTIAIPVKSGSQWHLKKLIAVGLALLLVLGAAIYGHH